MRPFAPFRLHIRRTAAPFAIAGALALSGCATFTNNSNAAVVNGNEISRDKLEAFIAEFAENNQLPLEGGVVATEDARNLLAGMIKADAYTAFLSQFGKPLTKSQRDAMREQLGEDAIGRLSPELQGLVVEINAATEAITGLEAPSDDDIENLYNENPSLTGAICAKHIVVKKKKTAQKMLAKLANGAAFEELAKKYSIEPAAKTTGGALGGESADGEASPCLSILEYQQNFDPEFTRGVLSARAGIPYGPVKSSFGWHVILLAEWDDVADAAIEIVKQDPGPNLATGWLANASISVDPAYGRWEPATGMITAG